MGQLNCILKSSILMKPPHRVFVCRDYRLTRLLDRIADQLAADGVKVVRGPESSIRQVDSHLQKAWSTLSDEIDAAVFSGLNPCTRTMMRSCPSLKGIVMPTIGTEAVDLAAATELDIVVAHGACAENYVSMAEATILMMLMMLYNPLRAIEVMKDARLRPPFEADRLWASMLMRKTIGLVGFGRIARAVARRLQGWDVDILAFSPHLHGHKSDLPPGIRTTSLDRLLASSDIVCVLASGGQQSRGLIGAPQLCLMKKTAYLINTARGSLVDESALYQALRSRSIAGAALDVFDPEPLSESSPLRSLNNVILTPHMIGHTKELSAGLLTTALENLRSILAGKTPVHCKNPQVLPRWAGRFTDLAGVNT